MFKYFSFNSKIKYHDINVQQYNEYNISTTCTIAEQIRSLLHIYGKSWSIQDENHEPHN